MTAEALDRALLRLKAAALRRAATRLGLTTTLAECAALVAAMPLAAALDEIARRRGWWFQRLLDWIRAAVLPDSDKLRRRPPPPPGAPTVRRGGGSAPAPPG